MGLWAASACLHLLAFLVVTDTLEWIGEKYVRVRK